MNFLKTKKPWN